MPLEGVIRRARIMNNCLNNSFDAKWLSEEGCEDIIKNAWGLARARGENKVMDKMKRVSRELVSWSREVVGDL